MKRLFLLFNLFAFFVLVSLAHAETLKVGISTNYFPVAFKNNDQIIGIEADLAQYVGQTTGMEIQIIEIPWDELETALKDNRIDVVMSGVSITDKRKERVDFTNSYMTIGQMVLIKADNIMTLSSKMSMYSAGKHFGVELKTTGQKFAEKEFSHSQVSKFDSVDEGITALKSD